MLWESLREAHEALKRAEEEKAKEGEAAHDELSRLHEELSESKEQTEAAELAASDVVVDVDCGDGAALHAAAAWVTRGRLAGVVRPAQLAAAEQAAAPAVGRTPCQPLRRQRRGRRQQNVKA